MSQNDAHHDLCEDILLGIGARPDARVWRQVTGRFLTMGRKDVVNVGIKGQSDLSGILACGKRLEVEVKTGSGRRSQEQRTWGHVMETWGAVYCVARSVEDVEDLLKNHARGCEACSARAQMGVADDSGGAEGISRSR